MQPETVDDELAELMDTSSELGEHDGSAPEDDGDGLLTEEAEAEFLDAVQIDEASPDRDFLRLPALVWRYGAAVSRMTASLLQAKREFDHTNAVLRGRAQSELDNDETIAASKVTVARVEALVKAQPQWLAARAKYDRALSAKTLASARLEALMTKQNALQSYAASRRVEAKLSGSSIED